MSSNPFMVALEYLIVLIIKLRFFLRHFWHGLNLKQTNVIMFGVPANCTKFSDEDSSHICVCTHLCDKVRTVNSVHFYRCSDFSSSGSKPPFFLGLFRQHTLCYVSGFTLQSLEIKKQNRTTTKNEATWNFKNWSWKNGTSFLKEGSETRTTIRVTLYYLFF